MVANTFFFIVSRPFVEYKGTILQDQLESKKRELEKEANALISVGGKVRLFNYLI
jgi:hypothetical protein